ncbi:uncharacterized protein C1orf198 homolog [Anabrus simplex]|uniref:uncharacterized protein C1orf198 homolog n=1 Tax=Anabrus simplex TaxID=316456 RepID=UPI0034DD31C4
MGSSSVELYAQEYFHSLNSIAERISSDVAATIAAYEDLWHTLSNEDQNQVVDETIIHPEAVLKYSFYPRDQPKIELYPRSHPSFNKYVDDEGEKGSDLVWRDEHSAPFSWMTRSQLDLSIFCDKNQLDVKMSPLRNRDASIPSKSKTGPSKQVQLSQQDSFVDPPSIVLGGSTSKLASALSPKLKFPPKSSSGDDNLLTKLKNKTAVLKIQSIKSVISKNGGENIGTRGDDAERQTLVQPRNNCSVVPNHRLSKSGHSKPVSKPKTPPPPPPIKPKQAPEPTRTNADPEKKALLQESPATEQMSKSQEEETIGKIEGDLDSLEDFHIDLNNPVQGDDVPKTGFDFLDNW